MSDAERLSARRAELEALWDKVFALVVQSGKDPSWADHIAGEAVASGFGSVRSRDAAVGRRLKEEGFPVDQS